jgi:hypothetical protein
MMPQVPTGDIRMGAQYLADVNLIGRPGACAYVGGGGSAPSDADWTRGLLMDKGGNGCASDPGFNVQWQVRNVLCGMYLILRKNGRFFGRLGAKNFYNLPFFLSFPLPPPAPPCVYWARLEGPGKITPMNTCEASKPSTHMCLGGEGEPEAPIFLPLRAEQRLETRQN